MLRLNFAGSPKASEQPPAKRQPTDRASEQPTVGPSDRLEYLLSADALQSQAPLPLATTQVASQPSGSDGSGLLASLAGNLLSAAPSQSQAPLPLATTQVASQPSGSGRIGRVSEHQTSSVLAAYDNFKSAHEYLYNLLQPYIGTETVKEQYEKDPLWGSFIALNSLFRGSTSKRGLISQRHDSLFGKQAKLNEAQKKDFLQGQIEDCEFYRVCLGTVKTQNARALEYFLKPIDKNAEIYIERLRELYQAEFPGQSI